MQGIVFKHLKIFSLKMREDELVEREHWIIQNDFSKTRPRSVDSETSIKSITKKEKRESRDEAHNSRK